MTKEEFSAEVHLWYDPLYRFALSLCKDHDNALDLTQNAFQKLATKADTLKDRKKIKSWLFSVLYREFVDDYRHARRFPKTSLELVTDITEDRDPRNDAALDADALMTALGQLDTKFRAPISLFYIEEFSYKEISKMLDIPIGTVMSRLRRAKDHLRKALESQPRQQTDPVKFQTKVQNG